MRSAASRNAITAAAGMMNVTSRCRSTISWHRWVDHVPDGSWVQSVGEVAGNAVTAAADEADDQERLNEAGAEDA
jgi:hypothetical protein